MITLNSDFIEKTIPNNNATITLNIAGKESTMNFKDFARNIETFLKITLQKVTDNGNTTTNDILVGVITLSGSDGIVYSNTINLSASSPAAVLSNTLGVDILTGKLYFKNNLNEIVYLDGEVDVLSFEASTGDLTLTDSLGNVSTTNLDGRYIQSTEIGAANGVAPLDSGGQIPSSYLPAIPINNTFVVADIAARLGLGADVGDVAVQIDTQESYILQTLPPSSAGNWVKLLFPASVASVNGQTGVVSLSTTNISEGTNKYANSTSVNPLIENYLGRGIFLYNSANKYVKYNTIQDAITAYTTNDVILLNNINITISASININKDVQITSLNSFITNTNTTPIFTDGGAATSLYLRGQLYLRNSAVATAFDFSNTTGTLYLEGDFDFRDTKTAFNCAKYYYINGVQTQTTDVLTFSSDFGGNLITRGVGVINYSGVSGVHNLTGIATTINVTSTSCVTFGEKNVFNVVTNKSTLGVINLNSGNIVLYNHLVNPSSGSCVTSQGTSTIKSFNTVFVSTPENIVKSSGTLNGQFNNSQFITGATSPLTSDGSFNVTMGYSTGNKSILSIYDGLYLDSTNFTTPIL